MKTFYIEKSVYFYTLNLPSLKIYTNKSLTIFKEKFYKKEKQDKVAATVTSNP